MEWRELIKYIQDTAEVCDFYTNDHQLISFNKQGALCFNRGGMWHPNEEKKNRYKRVDLDIIIQKIASAGLEPVIRSWTAFSMHNIHFLEYLDGLGLLDKITYLAYSDPRVCLPIKYIQKMTSLRILIIDTSKTGVYDKITNGEQALYKAQLSELVMQLPHILEVLFIHITFFNGSLANLPPSLRILCIISYVFNESLDYLPMSLEVLLMLQLGYYEHDILNFPPLLKMLALDISAGRYNGIIHLSPELEYLQLKPAFQDTFLAAIGGEDGSSIPHVKTLIVPSGFCRLLTERKLSTGSFQNVKIKNADAIHHTKLIEELLQ